MKTLPRRRPRVLVPFPPDVIAEVDKIVSNGERNAFLVDLIRQEIKRRRLLEIFENLSAFRIHPYATGKLPSIFSIRIFW